jgi:medium-chain acyl-[acyl-carrier-protein] hydrolase
MFDMAHVTDWIVRSKRVAVPRARLFCFPHAGGSASSFNSWTEHLPQDVEVCAVQLPGRGARILEPPANSIAQVIARLMADAVSDRQVPIALFGHSLGAIIGFEFARRLRSAGMRAVHLFVSGRAAPQLRDPEPPISHLETPAFVDAVIKRYQGIPAEILNDAEMMSLWLPALRADIAMNESYRYAADSLLDCPVSSFGGSEDASATPDELAAWRHVSSGPFRLRIFPGNHFYMQSAPAALLQSIRDDLDSSLTENLSI